MDEWMKSHSKVSTLGGIPCSSPLKMFGDYGDKPGRTCLLVVSPTLTFQSFPQTSWVLRWPRLRLGLESWDLPVALGWATSPLLPKAPESTTLSSREGLDMNPNYVISGKSWPFSNLGLPRH